PGLPIQAVLPSSCSRTYLAGPLRSRGITPLRRYYEPRRLPTRTDGWLCLPSRRWTLVHPVGSPRFPAGRSAGAAPNHPGELDRSVCPLLPGRWQASPSLAGWPLSASVTRPNRVQVLAAHAFASRDSARWIAPPHARSATCRTGNLHGKLLSTCE